MRLLQVFVGLRVQCQEGCLLPTLQTAKRNDRIRGKMTFRFRILIVLGKSL